MMIPDAATTAPPYLLRSLAEHGWTHHLAESWVPKQSSNEIGRIRDSERELRGAPPSRTKLFGPGAPPRLIRDP